MEKRFANELRAALKPPENLTVTQIADKYRVLGRGAAKPGRWQTSFVPFMADIMDAFSQDCIDEIWFVKPSQTGGTESLLNMLLYAIILDPGPAMLIEPTEALADEISQERLDQMIKATPELVELQSEDSDPTKKKKSFQSMTVYLAWSNSPTSLASRPIRYCLFDEVDKYKKFSGEEASPLALGKERTNTYILNRKLVYVSTPTLDTGYITRGEENCQSRFRYHIACPHCGGLQTLTFDRVIFDKELPLEEIEETAWYECSQCDGKIFNDQKAELVRRGRWIDLNSGLKFSDCIKEIQPSSVGFQISRLYSPWHSFGMVAAEFLRSKDHPERLMNWRNSWMAEPWVERFETKSEEELFLNAIDIDPLTVPAGSVALTAGIDPSGDAFWYVVLAWKSDMSPHLVQYGFLPTWQDVNSLIWESHYQIENTENFLPIWKSGIDTGGGQIEGHAQSMTEMAYDFLRKFGRGRIFGCKGISHQSTQKIKVSKIDKMPDGKPIAGGITLLNLDSGAFKDAISYRLHIPEGEAGRFTFHRETGSDFISHLLSEEKRINFKTGQSSWVKVKRSNHWLDACQIAYALADPELFGGVKVGRSKPVAKHQQETKESISSSKSPAPFSKDWRASWKHPEEHDGNWTMRWKNLDRLDGR